MALDTSKTPKDKKKVDISPSMSLGTILEKTGLKQSDITGKNYEKLKMVLSDNDIKMLEKILGVDEIADAGKKKELKTKISVEFGEQGKTKKRKGNPKDAGASIVKLAKGGDPSKFGMLSVKAGVDKNPEPTKADKIVGATQNLKKGGIVKKKSSRTRIAKRGFGIAKRGY